MSLTMILLLLATCVAFTEATYTCPDLQAPDNGNYTLQSGSMRCGATATFSCNPGYRLEGCITSFCTYVCPHGLQWSCPPPNCIGYCPKLSNPKNGYVNMENGVDVGDVASYCCASNYKLDGEQTRVCQDDLTWSGEKPKCRGVCQEPAAPSYGFVSVPNGVWVGSVAYYSCHEHFMLVGAENRTCEDDFQWSDSTPTCIPVCTKPADPSNGYVTAVEPIQVGNTVKYTCNDGYALIGSKYRTCMAGDSWNVQAPVCAKKCPRPKPPEYGYVAFKIPIIATVIAHFNCKPGYLLVGHASIACQSDGSWAYKFPTCVKVCSLPSAPANGGIIPATSPGIPVGDDVTYYCDDGYVLVGPETRTCVGGTIWTLKAPKCLQACSPPDAPSNGDVDTSAGLYAGAVAKYSCDAYYRLSGQTTTMCMSNATWSGKTPECIGVCDPPAAPAAGSVDTTQGLDVGDVATFQCNYGYVLDGDKETECLPGNQWSNPTPECAEVCFLPSAPAFGSVDYSEGLRVGAVVKYSCNDGYRLEGSAEATCMAGKKWSTPVPTCIEECPVPATDPNGGVTIPDGRDVGDVAFYYCNSGYVFSGCLCNKTVCMSGGIWSRTFPRCIEVCEEPVAPENGMVTTSGIKVGDVAMFFCKDGFGLQGSMKATCEAGGEWSEDTPTCVEVCDPPTDPGYGRVTVTGLMVGDTATYYCDTNYVLKGDKTRTCETGGEWSGDEPTCVGIVKKCTEPGAPAHGSVTTPNGLDVGMQAVYACDDGYDLVGTMYRRCLSDLTWSDEVPLCIEVCTKPADIDNGWVDTSQGMQVGDIIVYRCDKGYELVGQDKRTCQSGNTWSGVEPECVEVCDELMDPAYGDVTYSNYLRVGSVATYTCSMNYRLDGNQQRTCEAGGEWTGSQPKCVPVCSRPMAPENGDVDYSDGLDVGSVAVYSCDDGFLLKGESETTCMCGNKWSYAPPICVHVCTLPEDPENGDIVTFGVGPLFEVGRIIKYVCDDGYELEGFPTRICLEGNVWSGQAAVCVPETPTHCDAPEVPEYGSVDVITMANIGDVATYECDDGYVLVGKKQRVCLETGEWSADPPMCIFDGSSGSSDSSYSSFSSSMDDDTSSLSSEGPYSSSDNSSGSGSSGSSGSSDSSGSSSFTSNSGSSGPANCCVPGKIKMNLDGAGSVSGTLPGVKATVTPCATGRTCGAMGYVVADFTKLLKCDYCVRAPTCGRRMLVVKLRLGSQRSGWLFNIGDSKYNQGTGADGGLQQNDAEIKSYHPNITILASEKCPLQKIIRHFSSGCGPHVNKVTFFISNLHVRIVTDQGLDESICHRCLYALDGQSDTGTGGVNERIFIGLNRVVKHINKYGYGVCSATITWACPWCCY